MDIIEQAAKRLAELKKVGVEVVRESLEPAVHQPVRPVMDESKAAEVVAPVPVEAKVQSKRIELDLELLAANNIVTPMAERSLLADELRVIKRPILRNATGKGGVPVKNGNLIMVTSAVPSEGKSFTAANLAMSLAMELDHTVLLVDADVARPTQPTLFGIPPSKGLLDVLVDKSIALSDVILRTNIEKLSILPSGTKHARATELLASDSMTELLAEMASRYADRIIIFDSPPLLVTTESRVLAQHMGQVVVVVRAERTRHSELKHALALIESCPVKMTILNQASAGVANGHGYGYGYGYGYGESEKSGQESRT